VGDDCGRNQSDVPGQRRDPGRDEHRAQAPAHLVGAGLRLGVAVGLQAEPVLDRHEVEQAALGFGDQVHPVARGGQLAQPRLRLAPPGRMPAGAVKCDGEMHGL
jgi:hypothetical protein